MNCTLSRGERERRKRREERGKRAERGGDAEITQKQQEYKTPKKYIPAISSTLLHFAMELEYFRFDSITNIFIGVELYNENIETTKKRKGRERREPSDCLVA